MEIQADVTTPLRLLCGCWRIKLWSSRLQVQLNNWILSFTTSSPLLLFYWLCSITSQLPTSLRISSSPLLNKMILKPPCQGAKSQTFQHVASLIYSPARLCPPGFQDSCSSELLNRSKAKNSQKSEIEYLHMAHTHLLILFVYLIFLRQCFTM